MNSGEIPREMLGYSPRISPRFSTDFPAKDRQRPGDFLANPRENTKAILMFFFRKFSGKSQGKPLATIPLVWVSDEGLDKTPRNFSEIFPRASPRNCPRPPPAQEVCMTPATVRLGKCSKMRPGPQVTSCCQAFPSIPQDLPMQLSEKAFKDWPSLPQELCNVSQRTPNQLIKGPKIFERIPGKSPEGFSNVLQGFPKDFPGNSRQRPGEFPEIH